MNAEMIKALLEFQAECPVISKAKQGYGYKYAELDKIVDATRELRHKHGLVFTQTFEDNVLITSLYHISGGELHSRIKMQDDVKLNGMNPFQVDGSKITYYKRYAFCAILGIVLDGEDNDAKGKSTEPKKSPAKKTLNQNEFIRMVQAINNGDFQLADVNKKFTLDNDQKKTLSNEFGVEI
jgi:hypothetical protein